MNTTELISFVENEVTNILKKKNLSPNHIQSIKQLHRISGKKGLDDFFNALDQGRIPFAGGTEKETFQSTQHLALRIQRSVPEELWDQAYGFAIRIAHYWNTRPEAVEYQQEKRKQSFGSSSKRVEKSDTALGRKENQEALEGLLKKLTNQKSNSNRS